MYTYTRVIPRDLFNEAKLLKSLGRLALLIHNGEAPPTLEAVNDGDEFRIDQRADDGGLYVCSGLYFRVRSLILELYSCYNSKDGYTLVCNAGEAGEIVVFDQDGTLATEFTAYVESI